MTEPMVTEDDREIARRWLSEGQINVDQMGRAAVLVAIRQEYQAALAAEREAQVMDDLHEQDPRYSWMQNPNGRGIAYFNRVLHTSGVELSSEVRAMLLEEFAAVEARAFAAERERCAKVADQNLQDVPEPSPDPWDNGFASACKRIAAAIRGLE